MTLEIQITFNDLSFDKQEEIREEIERELRNNKTLMDDVSFGASLTFDGQKEELDNWIKDSVDVYINKKVKDLEYFETFVIFED